MILTSYSSTRLASGAVQGSWSPARHPRGKVVPLAGTDVLKVRAYEAEVVTAAGQHRYVVAIDINAAQHN